MGNQNRIILDKVWVVILGYLCVWEVSDRTLVQGLVFFRSKIIFNKILFCCVGGYAWVGAMMNVSRDYFQLYFATS